MLEFEPTNEKEGWLKRVLYLRATNLISKNKKLITKGFALWPQSRVSTSQGERNRLKQILGIKGVIPQIGKIAIISA